MKDRRTFPSLAAGQLWKMKHAFVQIVELGNRIIHFKMMRDLDEAGVRTQISPWDTLYGYLKARHARLVRHASSP